MTAALHTVRSITRTNWLIIIYLVLGLIGGIAGFPGSYLKLSNVLVGLCIFPFVIFVDGRSRFNYPYLIAIIIFSFLAYRYNIKIFYFFGLAFYVLFILEIFAGRINPLILFLIGVASPVFTQVSVILSFPIRLVLSEWACRLLGMIGLDVHADGNMILFSSYSFSVDEACMGLSMMAISLLMGVFVIAWHYKQTGYKLSFGYLLGFFVTVLILNILANLFRIMLLVLFRIPPENFMHEMIGIFCLIFYTIIPLYFLAKCLIRWKGTPLPKNNAEGRILSIPLATFLAVIGLVVAATGFIIDPVRAESEERYANVRMTGVQLEKIDRGITKLTTENLLIYIKPIPEFFTGEHTPLICWKGSGFEFKQVRKEKIAGREIFTGILVKEKAQLYTAWWYTDGKIVAIDQFTWRSIMFTKGKDFCLVNLTTSDPVILREELNKIFKDSLLRIE